MKRMCFVFPLLLLLLPLSASASGLAWFGTGLDNLYNISELIQSGTTTPIPFLLVDSATGQVGQSGLGASITITISKNGTAGSFNAALGTTGSYSNGITDVGNGLYTYTPTAAETGSGTYNYGFIYLHATCTGCQVVDTSAQVVAFNPNDPSQLGLTLTSIASASGLANVYTAANNAANSSSAANTVITAVSTKIGTAPSGFTSIFGVLGVPASSQAFGGMSQDIYLLPSQVMAYNVTVGSPSAGTVAYVLNADHAALGTFPVGGFYSLQQLLIGGSQPSYWNPSTGLSGILGDPAGHTVSGSLDTAISGVPAGTWAYTVATGLTANQALIDTWGTSAGPSTATYTGAIQTTHYFLKDGTTGQHSTTLTTNANGKPSARTYSVP